MALMGPLFSVKDSMMAMYIPSNARESDSNLRKCHHNMNYNKELLWRGLSKNPTMISLIFYNIDRSANLVSRLTYSSLIVINPSCQAKLDSLADENEIIVPSNLQSQQMVDCNLNIDQFDFDWKLSKSGNRRAKNSWISALNEYKQWEGGYQRPKEMGIMSETERQGNFNPNS